MTFGKLPKEVHRLLKRIERVSDGQAKVVSWDPDNVEKVTLEISPKEGLYEGGKFEFEMIMGEDFPVTPPIVRCLTPVYHPNIDSTDDLVDDTNVCLNMFEQGTWQEEYGLEGALQGILFLFYHPNIEDPLSPFFDPSLTGDEFEDNVKRSLKGEEVEGFHFKKNLVDKAELLIMNLIESNDDTSVEVTKGSSDDEHGENTLAGDPTVNVNAINDEVPVNTKEVDETVIPDSCNTNYDSPVDVQNVCNLEDGNIVTTNSESLTSSDHTIKQSAVLSSTRVHHCGRHNIHVLFQTFDALSPETNILLFVFSKLFHIFS